VPEDKETGMASIDFIMKRIEGKEKELDKLNKKMDRILKAQASGWKDNPYYYHESDIKYTERDIREAGEALVKWKDTLVQEQQKSASRNVPAITEFLDKWEERCLSYYDKAIKAACEESAKLFDMHRRLSDMRYGSPEYEQLHEEINALSSEHYNKIHGTYKYEKFTDSRGRSYSQKVKVADGEWEYAQHYIIGKYDECRAKLEKEVHAEYNRKYDFIIDRTNEIVGQITDASALKVGAKGDLNGYIYGTKGTAHVQTFGAGGYNIQCFHFRTTIHPAAPVKSADTRDEEER